MHPPQLDPRVEPSRALADLTTRLKRGKLQLQLKLLLAELRASFQRTDVDAELLAEERHLLTEQYQALQAQLSSLSTASQNIKSS